MSKISINKYLSGYWSKHWRQVNIDCTSYKLVSIPGELWPNRMFIIYKCTLLYIGYTTAYSRWLNNILLFLEYESWLLIDIQYNLVHSPLMQCFTNFFVTAFQMMVECHTFQFLLLKLYQILFLKQEFYLRMTRNDKVCVT